MPVPAQATLFNESVANGLTTSFPYQFMIASADDLAVELDGVATTTGFTVTGVGDANGGDIVFSVPPANGVKVLRYLDSELNRTEDYQQFGDFNAETVDREFDRLWLAMQSHALKLGRCVRAPISSSTGIFPEPAANNVIGWNEDGTWFKNFAPVDNTLLAIELASSESGRGAELVEYQDATVESALNERLPEIGTYSFLRAYSGPVTAFYVRGVAHIFDGGFGVFRVDSSDTTTADNGGTVLVDAIGRRWKRDFSSYVKAKWFGATGYGTNDDTASIQAAVDFIFSTDAAYTLVLPAGVCRLASTINITNALRIIGEGCSPYVSSPGARGNGSWLHFDHTGVGLSVDGTTMLSGVSFEKFGTLRNQPTPTPGWAPNDHDYDISIDNADVYIDDVLMLNPTRGVLLKNGDAGRLHIDRLRGQAFKEFVRVDKSYDVVRINSIHQWPFWQDNPHVHAYTMNNLDVIYLLRCDNPIINDPFSIFARSGLRIGEGESGTTSKFRVSNPDFDRGAFGIWVDLSVTSGCTGKVINLEHQGESGFVGSKAIFVQGNNNSIAFGNTTSALSSQNAVRVEGTGNVLTFGGRTHLYNFNQIADFFPAVEVLSGNTVSFYEQPEISGDGGTGGSYGGAGTIKIGPNGLRRGNFDTYIVSGESSRNGEIEFRFDYGTHTIPAGHIDRVHHVEATLPDDPSVSTQRELHAYSFVLETNHHEPNGGDIRGVKGIVRGNGGQANLRSAHFATQGYNGHTGDLTGVLADVFHSDVAPTDPAIGKSAAFLGQVGAGVSDGFILRGRETPGYAGVWPNVKYGFRVGTSTNAVKPTIANFFAHGGGGGALFRGVKSDIDETILFDVSALGKVVGQLFNSGNVVVANDSVATITPLSSTGFVLVWAQTTSANWIIRYYRVGASPAMGTVATGGSAASTTGALTGTTGTSGNLTISAKSDGTIDIENRSGATRTVYYAFIGG